MKTKARRTTKAVRCGYCGEKSRYSRRRAGHGNALVCAGCAAVIKAAPVPTARWTGR